MSQKNPHEKYMQAAQMEPEPQEAPAPEAAAEVTPTQAATMTLENLESLCREHICPACQVKIEAEQDRMRALAEMENFKKRLAREHDEQMRYASEKVLADILPALDNLDLALQYGSRNEACKDMLTGVEMTRKLLLEAVRKHGLEPVGESGEVFTPELHEAIAFDTRFDMDEGLVSAVLQRGYKLKDRLLRPAKVSISKSSE